MRNLFIGMAAIVAIMLLETVVLPVFDTWSGADLPLWPFALALGLLALPVVALYAAISGRARQ